MHKRNIDETWNFKSSNTKEFTHCYHIYPAMMIPQVARTLIKEYRPKGKLKLLFDPYMGSGTSLVEAAINNIPSIGTDLNPLARFISKVKTTHYNDKQIELLSSQIQGEIVFYHENRVINRNFERISNHSYWYSESNLLKLSFLTQLIDTISEEYQDFFKLALSEVVREVSFTRNGEFKRFRMPEEKIPSFQPDTFKLFEEKITRNLNGLKEFNAISPTAPVNIYDFNSSLGIPAKLIQEGGVDMIVTSPPYGDSRTTVAYGQFSRWANEWFGFENAKNLDTLLMGGSKSTEVKFTTQTIANELDKIKSLDTKRYYEVISFLNDYRDSMENVAKTVRKGGVICYTVGNRTVKGIQIPLDYFTAEMFENFGLKHQTTIVRGIPNKRMPAKTSPTNKTGVKENTMSNEYIVIMKKK